MSARVLDASALLALLLEEPGAVHLQAEISEALISAVNWSEVAAHFARNGVAAEAIMQVLDPLPFRVVPFDQQQALQAGLLITATRSAGLSLGDRACLALAKQKGLPACTADRAWLAVAEAVGVVVETIR